MEGLWYNGDNIYKSKAFSKKQLIELMNGLDGRKHTRLLVQHNKFYNGNNNTPRYQFGFSNQTGNDTSITELDSKKIIGEDEDYEQIYNELLNDAQRMFNLVISDLQNNDYSQAESTAYDFLQHWGL